ncbi:ABC transporter permease [Aerococcaceae bacterium NML190073]|nr:ABC transporter permease [Aerococcaceae bacterium NML190073]
MKLWYYMKATVIVTFKQFHKLALGLLMFPLLLGIFLGMGIDYVDGIQMKPPNIAIHLDNSDTSEIGKTLELAFAQLSEQSVVKLTDEAKTAEFTLVIPETFGQNLLFGDIAQTPMQLIANGNASSVKQSLLENLLKNLLQEPIEQRQFKELARNHEQPQDIANQIIQHVQSRLTQIEYQTINHQSKAYISGTQFYSIWNLGYIILMILMANVASVILPELTGLNKRIRLLPFTPAQRILYSVASSSIVFATVLALYITIWKIIDPMTFIGNPFAYLGHMSLMLLTALAISELVALFVNGRIGLMFNGLLPIVWLVFFGIIPDSKAEGTLLGIFLNNPLRRAFLEPLYKILRGEGLESYWVAEASLLCVIVVCLMLAIAVAKGREEYA